MRRRCQGYSHQIFPRPLISNHVLGQVKRCFDWKEERAEAFLTWKWKCEGEVLGSSLLPFDIMWIELVIIRASCIWRIPFWHLFPIFPHNPYFFLLSPNNIVFIWIYNSDIGIEKLSNWGPHYLCALAHYKSGRRGHGQSHPKVGHRGVENLGLSEFSFNQNTDRH